MYKILRAEELTTNIYLFEVEAKRVAKACEPGQFVIVRVSDEDERIPLTISDYDREKGTIAHCRSFLTDRYPKSGPGGLPGCTIPIFVSNLQFEYQCSFHICLTCLPYRAFETFIQPIGIDIWTLIVFFKYCSCIDNKITRRINRTGICPSCKGERRNI